MSSLWTIWRDDRLFELVLWSSRYLSQLGRSLPYLLFVWYSSSSARVPEIFLLPLDQPQRSVCHLRAVVLVSTDSAFFFFCKSEDALHIFDLRYHLRLPLRTSNAPSDFLHTWQLRLATSSMGDQIKCSSNLMPQGGRATSKKRQMSRLIGSELRWNSRKSR